MLENRFQVGDVVQLRSGGPLGTIISLRGGEGIKCLFHNTVSGEFNELVAPMECFRGANARPVNPEDQDALRKTSVAKSSLS